MNPALESLSCFDPRFDSVDAFTTWTQRRWVHFQGHGPLKHLPVRKAYAVADWQGRQLDHYAAVYAPDVAADLVDYKVLEHYTSSLQQNLIRDPEPDLNWFFPEKETEGVLNLLRFWQNVDKVYSGDELRRKLADWALPGPFGWLNELGFREGVVSEYPDEASLVAATDEGFLSFFVLDG